MSVLQDVNDQPSGKPIDVGSKLTDWDRGTTYGCGEAEESDDDMFCVDYGIKELLLSIVLSLMKPVPFSLFVVVVFLLVYR